MTNPRGEVLVAGNQRAAAAGGHNFIAIETEGCNHSMATGMAIFVVTA